jgi:WD40 repeat protein
VVQVAFAADGRFLVARDESGTVRIWQPTPALPRGKPILQVDDATASAFGPDGKWLVTAGDGALCRWDTATGAPLSDIIRYEKLGRAIAVHPRGQMLAAAVEGGVRLWDVGSGRTLGPLFAYPEPVDALAFSGDGHWLVAMTGEGSIEAWDLATRTAHEPRFRPDPVQAAFFDVQVGAGGRVIGCRCMFGLFLWDAAAARRVSNSDRRAVYALHPDGKRAVMLDENGLSLRRALDGAPAGPVFAAREPSTAEFSPDGSLLAVAGMDGSIGLWDTQTGQKWREPLSSGQGVESLIFGPAGNWVVASAPDGTLRQWDVRTGRRLGPPWHNPGAPLKVSAGPDGKTLAAQSSTGGLRLWRLPDDDLELQRIELQSWVALGARLDPGGSPVVVPATEWQQLRRELDAVRPASPARH